MTEKSKDFIKFLGTAGARFVMIRQLRASGGLWICCEATNVLIDPGPGSIVRCAKSIPKLDPSLLDAIILTHRHLDHSGDINVMIEAMTEGGFKKKGIVFCPEDAIETDSVILGYIRSFPEKIVVLGPLKEYKVGNFKFKTSFLHLHPVQTYGLRFKIKKIDIGLLTDTKYFSQLKDFYKGVDILIIYVVFFKPHPDIEHLSLPEAETLIQEIKPKKAILTHFGMTMLSAKPHLQAEALTKKLKREVLAAFDGMTLYI